MKTKNHPLITIGITCFNAADTIERAVYSALAQDWPNIEIIIVDDGSVDDSVAVIERITQENRTIRLIQHNPNKGFPSALNSIVENASGVFIAFFDDDDVSRSDRLTKQYERIKSYEDKGRAELVFCYSDRNVFIDGSLKKEAYVRAIGRSEVEPSGRCVADFLLLHDEERGRSWGQFGSCTLLIRKDTLKKIGGFDPDFLRCAEWDLAVRGAFLGAHFISVGEALIDQHKTFTQDKSGKKPLIYAVLLRKKHKEYLKRHGAYWGSIMLAYSRFSYARGEMMKSRFFYLAALILLPKKLMRVLLKKARAI